MKRVLLIVMVVCLLLPKDVYAAENTQIDNYYGVYLDKDGTASFRQKSGTGAFRFPAKVQMIWAFKGPDNTKATMICTTDSGQQLKFNAGQTGRKADPPTQSITCKGTSERGLNNFEGMITHAFGTDGHKYGLYSPPTKPVPPDPNGGTGNNGGSTGGNNGSGGGSTGGGGTDPPVDPLPEKDLRPKYSNGKITWDAIGTRYELWKGMGVLDTVSVAHYATSNPGTYTIVAYDKNGERVGRGTVTVPDTGGNNGGGTTNPPTDPKDPNPPDTGGVGGGGTCDREPCTQLVDLLACPLFDDYLGRWQDTISAALPPPPNWNQVASIMTDHIVPAMGDELVRRTPEMARIIADEFQRREKSVSPPPSKPAAFRPYVPRLNDPTGNMSFQVRENVPQFEPDYSGSQGFTIPDPTNIPMDNQDAGYSLKKPVNDAPAYRKKETTPENDIGYKVESKPVQAPDYKVSNQDANKPDMEYQKPKEKPMPDYKPNTNGSIPKKDYNHPPDQPVPKYRMP